MKMRKSITLSDNVYIIKETIKKPNERLKFYELIFEHLFKEKPINYDKIEEPQIQTAIAILLPELRKIHSKFNNRNGKNNNKNSDSLFICKKNNNETKRNLTEKCGDFSSDYYNINNIINYIYNIINQSINNNKNTISYVNITNKDIITNSLKKISQENAEQYKIFIKLLNELCQKEKIKINGVWVEQTEALDTIVGILTKDTGVNQLLLKIDEVSQLKGLKNKTNYLISSLFNLANSIKNSYTKYNINQQKQIPTGNDIIKHNYTIEQLNSVYDNLDDIEI